MALSGDQIERMVVEITLGMSKGESLIQMTTDASEMWDQLEAEIRELKAKGMIVDTAPEIPAVVRVTQPPQ